MEIVITGYGMLSALGLNKEENAKKLFAGISGIDEYEFRYKDTSIFSQVGVWRGELPYHPHFDKYKVPYDRALHTALISADEAMKQAGFSMSNADPLRVGSIIGTSLGGMRIGDVAHETWIGEEREFTREQELSEYPMHTVVNIVSTEFGFKGTRVVISTACSSGANAMVMAADLLKAGSHDMILVGAIDPVSRYSYAGFASLKAIEKGICQPYSASTGINLGEAAAFFVLERKDAAQKRGAKIIATVKGYALSADAYHATSPDVSGNGAYRSMTQALKNSGLDVKDLTYINGHGTGTPANDHAEVKAWKAFVGEHTEIPLITNKATFGHCMATAGAIELAATLLSMEEGKIPPTMHFDESLTEERGIDFVPNTPRECEVKHVLSNSFAFGGNNCSVVLSKYEENQKDSTPESKETEEDEVVITGMACSGVGGASLEEFYQTLQTGESWIEKMDEADCKGFTNPYRGKLANIPYKKYIPSGILRRVDQVIKLAMSSGRQALLNSKLKITPQNCARIGVIHGTSTGPSDTLATLTDKVVHEGILTLDANLFPNAVLNAAPGQFSIANMLKGPTSTVTTANLSGLHAFIYAVELLKTNQADVIVVLAADEWNELLQAQNESLDILSENGALPFDTDAAGMILSQGSTAFVLERKSHAKERGAKVLAQVYGYGMTSDNSGLYGLDPEGGEWMKAVEIAQKQAGDRPIDYYAATSYGIADADKKEIELMENVLPEHALVRSLTRLIGTPSGSMGTYGLISAVYALTEDAVPNQGEVSEKLDPNFKKLLDRPKNHKIKTAAVGASSFGASYASVIVGLPN
ncbi:beta-ketoacyl-ACP synthase [Clostridia bacterium]|nr:beta-ketoacyl-ACP synthase [Clostridia bacterium]